ncbi:hypothetical protein V495_02986 [Pseudogymnoascus sp. VKM F-4514 (FW-929)]|nr:hypothetical protein V495_02986 [Pseudogymnoascus sp. VKM F-4514 (FW-929)]KFY56376.1 hypothetical protein V497_06300 [Pseudogymnoascus sp. VKM F-4516 (FW-969)]
MNVTVETELMQNQKHASIMAPENTFNVLQTSNGNVLFFSIGDDGVFYLTREVTSTGTGWTKLNLSSSIDENNSVVAKSFALSQNPQSMALDMALITTINGIDALYVCLGHSIDEDGWENGITWTLIPFDATYNNEPIIPPDPLTIADVFIMNIPYSGSAAENIFVDIRRDPSNDVGLLDRYYIQPGSSQQWVARPMEIDLVEGSISCCLGYRSQDLGVPGIYTLGMIGSETELVYIPQTNPYRIGAPPTPTLLNVPTGASCISSVLNPSTGTTDLFIAGTDGIYVFTTENQKQGVDSLLVIPAASVDNGGMLRGVTQLSVLSVGDRTAIFGYNAAQQVVFYVYCTAGSEATPTAWSAPIPIASGAEAFAFYLNNQTFNNVLFVHLSGENLLQLTQDPSNSTWSQRSILLPPADNSDMVQFNSFTSHVQIQDSNGVNLANKDLFLTSTTPVSVYIDNDYHLLTPSFGVAVTTDITGALTIIQATEALTNTSFQVALAESPDTTAQVDPLTNAWNKLSTVQSGDDLSAAQIQYEDGSTEPLIPDSVSPTDKATAAQCIVQFLKVKDALPPDGSIVTPPSNPSKLTPVWGATCGQDGFKYQEGDDAAEILRSIASPELPTNFGDWLRAAAGDIFHWLKKAWDDVVQFVVSVADDIYYFVVQIGDQVYHAVMDCYNAVAGAVEFIMNKIEAAFEKLVRWLGFIFNWGDIKRTHLVMKNIIKQSAYQVVNSLDTLEGDINSAFTKLEQEVSSWEPVSDPGSSNGSLEQQSSQVQGTNSPQSNWAVHHTKNGQSVATTTYDDPTNDPSGLSGLLDDLKSMYDTECDDVQDMINEIKTKCVDNFSDLTPAQVIQEVIGILAEFVLKSAQNVITTVIEVAKLFIETLLGSLDAPLNIPIISPLYKEFVGDDLSFLDLVCLIGAIPTTIIYKLITNTAPFPDNDQTTALINAKDMAAIISTITSDSPSPEKGGTVADGLNTINASLSDIVSASLSISAFFGSIIVAIFAALKRAVSPSSPTLTMRVVSATSYLVYVCPNITNLWIDMDAWYTTMNYNVTTISIAKTILDNSKDFSDNEFYSNLISPLVETIINVVWVFPPCFAIAANDNPQDSDWLALLANLAFDIGGMLTVLTSPAIVGPGEVCDSFFVAAEVLGVSYGALCCCSGGCLLAGK